jgi:hypothetical protein
LKENYDKLLHEIRPLDGGIIKILVLHSVVGLAENLILVSLLSIALKHLEKFPNILGRNIIHVNNPSRKHKALYVYRRNLTPRNV